VKIIEAGRRALRSARHDGPAAGIAIGPDPPLMRRAGTCHLHQVGRQAQMTQLKYYPEAQITQGADRVSAPTRWSRLRLAFVSHRTLVLA
jgi:hypothetical protein